MSGVTSLNTGAGDLTGAIALSSSQPGLLGISSSPSSPYTVTFAPINAQVNQLNGKLGNVVLASPDNTLLFSPTALGATINVSGYVPSGSGGAGSALLQAQNLTGASPLAWSADTSTPPISTVAYAPGAVVIYSGTTFVCLVAQPVGSALPVNGTHWQSIGGGGGGGGSSITNGGATLGIDNLGALTYTTQDVASNTNTITLQTVVPTTTPPGGAGDIALNSGASLSFSSGAAAGNISLSNPAGTIQVALGPSSYMSVGVSGGGSYGSGTVPFYDVNAEWNAQRGYARGNIVALGSLATPSGWYLCASPVTPVTSPAANPSPHLGGNWLPVSGGGGGGNWSFKGNFNTTAATAYAVNDVVFDSVTTTHTYICIAAYTTGATPLAPSANATNWLLFATQGGGGGGNWSFKGNFNTTAATPYAVNDVVFDSLNPTDTYICIVGYTTVVPFPTAPSANATNWLLLARQGDGTLITNGASGSTLAINSTGSLTYTTTAGSLSTNNINLNTTYDSLGSVPTAGNIAINCCQGAGIISMTNEGEILISADIPGPNNENINNITISTTTSPQYSAGGIIKIDADKVLDLVVGSGTATLQTVSGSSQPSLLITPGQGALAYVGGGALYNCGTFSGTSGYGKASVVQDSGVSYIALSNVAPPASGGSPNPFPPSDPTNWLPIGGGGATNALIYSGLWSASATYAVNDVALFGGNNWVCLVNTTAGQSPISTPASWRELATVSTGQSNALPINMIPGTIPQNTSAGLLGVSLYNNGSAYMKGNTVVDVESAGMYQSHTNGNTGNKPSTDNGTNWSYLGVAPQIQNSLITYGNDVPGNFSSTPVTFPGLGAVNALDFGDVLTAGLSPALGSYGGCQYTFNGFSSLTWGQSTGVGEIVGVQLFDSGTSNTHSFSTPVYFDTPFNLTGAGSSVKVPTPPFSLNIITPVVAPSGQQAYSLAYIVGVGSTVDDVSNYVTGAGSYIFSGSTSNITF